MKLCQVAHLVYWITACCWTSAPICYGQSFIRASSNMRRRNLLHIGEGLRLRCGIFCSLVRFFQQFWGVGVDKHDVTSICVKPTTPASSPTKTLESAPAPTKCCTVPKFVGNWEEVCPEYPLHIAEAQGAIIGNDLVVISGFVDWYNKTTLQSYALDVTNLNGPWRLMDDMPTAQGITHGAFVVVGMKLYMCGGYLGGSPGPHTNTCLIYDHTIAPGSGQQWSTFAPLPDEGRSGGGMIYSTHRNALYYAAGAIRPIAGNASVDDKNNTWMYNLDDPDTGWVPKAPIPYVANHVSFVTGKDELGNERHFILGGQTSDNEATGNHVDNVEWDAIHDVWIRRASSPMPRGHAASSTRAIGCGFIVAGGAINNVPGQTRRTSDVSYYDISTDRWTSIGNLTSALNTPVCDFGSDGYLYCESGLVSGKFSWRRKIAV